MNRLVAYTVGATIALSAPVAAQRGDAKQPPPPRQQQALVRQVRQAFAGVVKRQLNLSEEQSRKLQSIDTKYQRQRNDLLLDERNARQDLRVALADSTPDQGKVDTFLSQLIQAQHKRAELLEAEQKELAGFLNPVQRAKYLALREQLQRRVTQLRQEAGPNGARGAGGARGAVPPPPER